MAITIKKGEQSLSLRAVIGNGYSGAGIARLQILDCFSYSTPLTTKDISERLPMLGIHTIRRRVAELVVSGDLKKETESLKPNGGIYVTYTRVKRDA